MRLDVGIQRPGLFRAGALLAIAAVAPLVLFAGVNSSLLYLQRQDDLRSQAIADARRVSEAVDRELAGNLDAAQALAGLPQLDNPRDPAGFGEIARREQKRHPLWLTVLLLDPNGQRLVNSRAPRLGQALEIASVREAVRTARPTVGEIRKGPGEFGIPLRAPVVRDGRVEALVTVVMRPRGIRDALLVPRLPSSWITTVVDASGKVVARTHGDLAHFGQPASARALAARTASSSGVYDGVTLEGVETVSAFWKSPATGWSVHIGIPKGEFEAPLRRSLWFTAAGSFVSLALAGIFVALLLRELKLRRQEAAALEQSGRLEALGRLTGGVAHDFNNLLMVIQGSTEMLERRLKSDQVARPIAAIKDATGRAAKLTRELLVFARGGASEQTVEDINPVVENLLDSIVEAVGPATEVKLDLDSAAGAVKVDRVQLEVALINLAVNARDAMGRAGRLTIATRRDGAQVELSVADTGPGIPADVIGRIFDPFFTTKGLGAGTGLGLTQVYSFAKHSGGRATAASRPGRGAVITIALPATTAPAPVRAPPKPLEEVRLDGRRVLLVDDDDQIRALTAGYLRERGAAVVEAADAVEALARLDAEQGIDVLVSDIAMPGDMNGLALAEAALAARPGLPVLLVSGYSSAVQEVDRLGLTLLWKPYALAELGHRIARLAAGGPSDRGG